MGKYFDTEMRLLQEAAQDFARAFPEKARMLGLQDIKDRDPYVERLLEGMAFLTAEVKQRIDDDVPELSESLLSHVRPGFLRPFPSCCIMQFTPRPGQMRQTTTLPKGTRLTSKSLSLPDTAGTTGAERLSCGFRTTSDVVLQPLRLAAFRQASTLHGRQEIQLHFQCDHGVAPAQLDLDTIKLYLHGDPATAMALYRALAGQAEEVRIAFPGERLRPVSLGGQQAIRACHLDGENLLLGPSGRGFLGFHLLHEYFCFREKYQFITLGNLATVSWPKDCCEFVVHILLTEPLAEEFRLSKDNFRLHCAPAINLFETSSEPVCLSHKQTAYPVVADNHHPTGVMVYSVDGVTGNQPSSGQTRAYAPLPSFSHRSEAERYFHVNHRLREGRRPMTWLTLGGATTGEREILSCAITACNGNIPREHLQIREIKAPAQNFPSNITCENITRPSRMLMPPQRPDYRLALIAHLTVSYNSLADIDSFRQLLSLYDWSDEEQSVKRIRGIGDIRVTPLSRIYRGALLRGMDIQLEMDENAYIGPADAYLFGTVLHHFFTMYATINAFVQTGCRLTPSKSEMTWEPLLGENFLI